MADTTNTTTQNVTTAQLQKALQQLAAAQGKSVREFVLSQGYAKEADVEAKIKDILAKIDAITKIDDSDGVESLAEKINAIQDLLNNEDGVVQQILDKLTKDEKAISDLSGKVDNNFKLLSDAIDALKKANQSNTDAINNLSSSLDAVKKDLADKTDALNTEIAGVKKTVDILTGDETVDGSVKNLIKTETDRAKAAEASLQKAINTAKSDAITSAVSQAKDYTDAEIKKAIDNLDVASNETIVDLQNRVKKVEDTLEDTTDENGELQKGLVSRVSDVESKLAKEISDREAACADTLAQAKAYTDANTVKAEDLQIDVIVNVFTDALYGKDDTSSSSSSNGDNSQSSNNGGDSL